MDVIYISESGSDVGGDGSEGNPFQTLQEVRNNYKKYLNVRLVFTFYENNFVTYC